MPRSAADNTMAAEKDPVRPARSTAAVRSAMSATDAVDGVTADAASPAARLLTNGAASGVWMMSTLCEDDVDMACARLNRYACDTARHPCEACVKKVARFGDCGGTM